MSVTFRRLEAPEPVLAAILDGSLTGAVLRAAAPWPPFELPADRIELPSFVALPGDPPMRTWGRMLAPTETEPRGPPLGAYLEEVEAMDRGLDRLLPGVEPLLTSTLGALSGLPAARAETHGRRCGIATLRELPPGRAIPLHNDTYAPSLPWGDLLQRCDPATLLSFYVLLRAPEQGGVLQIANAVRGDPAIDYGSDAETVDVPLATADLVLFDAGRRFHRVSTVGGRTSRRTLGGFCAPSRDGRRLYFWG